MTSDFLLDTDLDLLIINGDLVEGDSTEQHKLNILLAAPGHYKQTPKLGADIGQYLNDTIDKQAIKQAMKDDGMKDVNVNINNGLIKIEGSYE